MAETPLSPPVRCLRRPGDFGRRSVVLFQAGTTTSCCCCLHWIGAAAGGLWGFSKALQAREGDPAEPTAGRFAVRNAFLLAIAVTIPLIGLVIPYGERVYLLTPILVALALIPSLFFVPAGLAAMAIGWWSKRANNPPTEQGTKAFELGCRLAWMSLVWAIGGMLLGYAIMWLIVMIMSNRPR